MRSSVLQRIHTLRGELDDFIIIPTSWMEKKENRCNKVNASKAERPYPLSSQIHHASLFHPKPVIHQFSRAVLLNFFKSVI